MSPTSPSSAICRGRDKYHGVMPVMSECVCESMSGKLSELMGEWMRGVERDEVSARVTGLVRSD